MIPERTISLELEGLLARLRSSGRNAAVLGIGLDVETNRVVDRKAARFFLTDNEQEWLKGQSATTSSKALLRVWTVKEAIFKADTDNVGKTIAEYVLDNPSAWEGSAYRQDQKALQFHYTSIEVDGGFLSIAVLAKGEPECLTKTNFGC